jgi:hypothetical protein
MALVTDYTDLASLKAHLRITDTADDTALGFAITAASRAIDQYCNRWFGKDSAATDRVYTYRGNYIEGRIGLLVNDIADTTGMTVTLDLDYDGTFETSLTNGTDYDLWPWNAAQYGEPYTAIVLRPRAGAWFPAWARGVKVHAIHGYGASVPTVVAQACLIQAARFFVRRDSPYGIAGSPELGSEIRLLAALDPDVQAMLTTVKRPWGLA